MSTIKDRIYIFLKERPGERFSDSEIRRALGIKYHQQVNERCRALADEGKIMRRRIDGILKNSYQGGEFPEEPKEKVIEEGEIQAIEIPLITLVWSPWFPWKDFEINLRYSSKGVSVPGVPGVYEAKYRDHEERLTIGKASNLRMRVKQGLVKGKLPHPAGRKIRENEDLLKIVVRWATTDRPSCVEEELHERYRLKFGRLPKYTLHT